MCDAGALNPHPLRPGKGGDQRHLLAGRIERPSDDRFLVFSARTEAGPEGPQRVEFTRSPNRPATPALCAFLPLRHNRWMSETEPLRPWQQTGRKNLEKIVRQSLIYSARTLSPRHGRPRPMRDRAQG